MLISESHQFLFFHVAKAAGTSVRSALQPYCLPVTDSRWSSFLRHFDLPKDYRRYRFLKHASVCEAEGKLPAEMFADYRRITFVRNPWDRLVSQYVYRFRKRKKIEFSDYVDLCLKQGNLSQHDFLADKSGSIDFAFIGRFESLSQDYQRMGRELGVALPELPTLNASRHRTGCYQEYYSNDLRQKLQASFAADQECFDYEF